MTEVILQTLATGVVGAALGVLAQSLATNKKIAAVAQSLVDLDKKVVQIIERHSSQGEDITKAEQDIDRLYDRVRKIEERTAVVEQRVDAAEVLHRECKAQRGAS